MVISRYATIMIGSMKGTYKLRAGSYFEHTKLKSGQKVAVEMYALFRIGPIRNFSTTHSSSRRSNFCARVVDCLAGDITCVYNGAEVSRFS